MEKELNIAAILKEKPNAKLWSPIVGHCTFKGISSKNGAIVASFVNKDGEELDWDFNEYGKTLSAPKEAEVCLFPSKLMQDWSKFAWEKGDVLINGCGFQCIFKEWASDDYTKFYGCYSSSRDGYEDVPNADTMKFEKVDNNIAYGYIREIEKEFGGNLNLETLQIEKPKQEFKDGDILVSVYQGKYIFIYKEKNKFNNPSGFYASLSSRGGFSYLSYDNRIVDEKDMKAYKKHVRLATDSEKQQLIDALAKGNKAWDAEKKMLVDLPKKCEFKAFDKVLFKNWASIEWTLGQYSHSRNNLVVLVGGIVLDCDPMIKGGSLTKVLPYNDQTAHLLGTTDEWKGGNE